MPAEINSVKNTTNSEESVLTDKEQKWLDNAIKSYNRVSPLKSSYLKPTEMFQSLKNSISYGILTNSLPKANKYADFSVITEQLFTEDSEDDEIYQWKGYFDHYLKLTPSFLFKNNQNDENYIIQKTNDFINFLYTPLLNQYDTLLVDIIYYNYSPFKIDINLFKNK